MSPTSRTSFLARLRVRTTCDGRPTSHLVSHSATERVDKTFKMTIIMVIMTKRQPFALIYGDEVKVHLRAIEAKHHSLIASEIEDQLRFQPDVETRNRKPLQRPVAFGAEWELRLGPDNRFRAFYQVKSETRQVLILAIGVKERNRLLIGGEEFEL